MCARVIQCLLFGFLPGRSDIRSIGSMFICRFIYLVMYLFLFIFEQLVVSWLRYKTGTSKVWWLKPQCSRNKTCTAVGPLSKTLNPKELCWCRTVAAHCS